ncbi:unnamed protein product, partial [Allacma fusca]
TLHYSEKFHSPRRHIINDTLDEQSTLVKTSVISLQGIPKRSPIKKRTPARPTTVRNRLAIEGKRRLVTRS